MMPPLSILLLPILGYLSGSLSFGLWITRYKTGKDLREAGSRHITTTNTIRQAGWAAGVLVFILDILKGYLPVMLAVRLNAPGWILLLTGSLAIIGHCWPIFAGFRGGMGLAATAGVFLAVYPLAVPIGLGLLVILVLTLRHTARASVIMAVLIPVVLWVIGVRGPRLWMAIASGVIVAGRFLQDWHRKYQEVWLDRPQE